MSLPHKKRGFRKIIIEGKEFSWRFNSQIEINPASCKANKLLVDFEWIDPWLALNHKDHHAIATPSFTRQAIEFALRNNWDITKKTGITKVKYIDTQFTIVP